MTLTPARDVAFKILLRVEREQSYAVELLNSRLAEKLSPADRGLAQEMVMGCLRWQLQLDWLAAHFSGKAPAAWDTEVRVAMRMGIYQLRFLERVPASAAVNQSVELVKKARKASAAGLVNAVLRKVTREPIEELLPPDLPASRHAAIRLSHPAWLLERWERHYGGVRAEAIALANNQPPPAFIRIRPGETVDEGRPCRYVRNCRELESASAAAAGRYAFQDEASQIVPHLLAPRSGELVLDLCAAPGIKAGAMLEMAPGCLLVACDIHPARLRLVEQLASSSAARRPLCVALDGTRPLPFCLAFHRILLDAPCSGTGTIRRNPEIKWRLKGSDLPLLAAKQRWLLSNALDALLIGGRLVYATCSIEPEENQEVVKQVLEGRPGFSAVSIGRLPLDFLTREGENLLRRHWYFSTLPDQGLDGFFAAVIERTA